MKHNLELLKAHIIEQIRKTLECDVRNQMEFNQQKALVSTLQSDTSMAKIRIRLKAYIKEIVGPEAARALRDRDIDDIRDRAVKQLKASDRPIFRYETPLQRIDQNLVLRFAKMFAKRHQELSREIKCPHILGRHYFMLFFIFDTATDHPQNTMDQLPEDTLPAMRGFFNFLSDFHGFPNLDKIQARDGRITKDVFNQCRSQLLQKMYPEFYANDIKPTIACNKCGRTVTGKAKFCGHCGNNLENKGQKVCGICKKSMKEIPAKRTEKKEKPSLIKKAAPKKKVVIKKSKSITKCECKKKIVTKKALKIKKKIVVKRKVQVRKKVVLKKRKNITKTTCKKKKR